MTAEDKVSLFRRAAQSVMLACNVHYETIDGPRTGIEFTKALRHQFLAHGSAMKALSDGPPRWWNG